MAEKLAATFHGPATDLRGAIVKVIQGWQFADAEVEEFADELLAVVAVRPVAAQERECTCYPGGFSPETYEGPQVWCDEHGLPSAAYALGLRQGAESPIPVAAQARADDWDMRGGSMWLDREQWGIIFDALIEHRASALARKGGNSESTSDVRADMCVELLTELRRALTGDAP